MHWIGIGFLIAIGFGLASILLPLAIALIPVLWELKWIVLVIVGLLVLLAFGIAYPDFGWGVLGWGFIGLVVYGFISDRKEKKAKKQMAKSTGQ